jgi:hypothetical protein
VIKIAVTGARSDRREWNDVQNVPKEQLPPLTPEQEKTAKELHIPGEMYQRSALAGRRTADRLLRETEWLARFLQRELASRAPQAAIKSVVLDTWEQKFQIEIAVDGRSLPLHLPEHEVEELFDLSSADAEQRLLRNLEYALHRFGVL